MVQLLIIVFMLLLQRLVSIKLDNQDRQLRAQCDAVEERTRKRVQKIAVLEYQIEQLSP